ncbi:MAG: hypothetical protein Tsb0020_36800 [Haliangiales bacterium]
MDRAAAREVTAVEQLADDIDACLRDLGRALAPRLFPDSGGPRDHTGEVLGAFATLMTRDLAAIERCVRDYERYANSQVTTRRDQAQSALRCGLMRVRTLLTAAHGASAVRLSGLDRRVPEPVDALLVYADQAARRLQRAADAYPEPAPFASFDFVAAAQFIAQHTQALRAVAEADDTRALARAEAEHAELVERCMNHRDIALALIETLAPMADMRERAEALRRQATSLNISGALELPEVTAPPALNRAASAT